jgi:hypothetical protein
VNHLNSFSRIEVVLSDHLNGYSAQSAEKAAEGSEFFRTRLSDSFVRLPSDIFLERIFSIRVNSKLVFGQHGPELESDLALDNPGMLGFQQHTNAQHDIIVYSVSDQEVQISYTFNAFDEIVQI